MGSSCRKLNNFLKHCTDAQREDIINKIARRVYAKSKHAISIDICRIQAQNAVSRIAKNVNGYKNSTVDSIADDIIWAFSQ